MAITSPARFVAFAAFVFARSLLMADAMAVTGAGAGRWVADTNQPASIAITNVMEGGVQVSAHCHSVQQDLPTNLIANGASFNIHFEEDPNNNNPWICDFLSVGGTSPSPGTATSFPVWTHDGTPYLSACADCSWKVQDDGFYILNTGDNLYHNVQSWNP